MASECCSDIEIEDILRSGKVSPGATPATGEVWIAYVIVVMADFPPRSVLSRYRRQKKLNIVALFPIDKTKYFVLFFLLYDIVLLCSQLLNEVISALDP